VFYFDRVAPSSVHLARHFQAQGAIVIFEPSSIRDPKLFEAALAIADVVKYSNERLGDAEELAVAGGARLQVETLGKEGLRYRYGKKARWWHVPPFSVASVRDTVGSGDWCTAGFIHLLGKSGRERFLATGREEMEAALRFGQALAAVNCFFEGARGAMYSLEKPQHMELVQRVWMNGVAEQPLTSDESPNTEILRGLCPSCEDGDVVRRLVGSGKRMAEMMS
jgi:sugar/nucleoside kinase (ribokinase family)